MLRKWLQFAKKQAFLPLRRWIVDALPGADRNYAHEAGDPMLCSVVAAAAGWIARNVAQTQFQVVRRGAIVEGAPALALLQSPNAYYDGSTLWQATIASLLTHGNAYWMIVGETQPDALYWLHPDAVTPYSDVADVPIKGYKVKLQAGEERLARQEVVHLRYGFDPENPYMGASPLRSLYRAIVGDHEAQTFATAILRNLGVIGLVIAPKQSAYLTPEQQGQMEREFTERFTREGRGRVYIPSEPVEVQLLQHDFAKLDVSPLTNLFEERICAVLGIPPMVLHLGAGTQHATYSNAEQAYRAAWESCMTPLIQSLASQLTSQLMPRYGEGYTLQPDWHSIPALVDLMQQRARIYLELLDRGVATVAEVRRALGLPTDESQEILLLPLNRTPVEGYLDAETTIDQSDGDA